jgi:hypothetical protein
MGTRDDERLFLEGTSMVDDAHICFLPIATRRATALLAALRESGSWAGSDRPDFYSDKHKLSLEVMRVDDHPQVGKVTNPTLARQRELEREVRAAFPSLGHDADITVIADTGLSTAQDHNFDAYRQAFTRIVVGHSRKVDTYRNHHPQYGLAMLVHDESSAYAETEHPARTPTQGETVVGQPHYWFVDDYFTDIIATSTADFVIWSTPNKHIWHINAGGERLKAPLPALAIYDIKAMAGWQGSHPYDPGAMVSVEA